MGCFATTRGELIKWQKKFRNKLADLLGCARMESCALRPRITGVERFDGYSRQRVIIQTEPGISMPFFVLIPSDLPGPFPAIIAPHGHCGGGKRAVVGEMTPEWMPKIIKDYDYDYGVQFAREGFIAFCPDARGAGERREEPLRSGPDSVETSCYALNSAAMSQGLSLAGMWAWDLSRLVDYVETRRDCIKGQIGCAGLSGGGLQTLYVSALDERIKCAVISGYFYGAKESLLLMSNCACNYVPGLWNYADMGDIGALIAPRPLLIETGDKDSLNGRSGLKNVKSQVAITRRAYKLLGANSQLANAICKGEHRWYRTGIPWMKRWL
jgi:dienelactone hydrolase